MRAHFIFALAFGLGACGGNSYNNERSLVSGVNGDVKSSFVGEVDAPVDFRFPIYLVPDDNFWSGCADVTTSAGESCRTRRLFELEAGVEQWLAYFPLVDRPVITVVDKGSLPGDADSLQVVDLFVDNKRCVGVETSPCFILWACYEHAPKDVVFMDVKYITAQVVAHELGHAFGLPHTDLLNDDCSSPIMSRPVQSEVVTDLDVQSLCWKHSEIMCPLDQSTLEKTTEETASCPKREESKTENTCK